LQSLRGRTAVIRDHQRASRRVLIALISAIIMAFKLLL
jgi:hypothetical protein